MDIENKKELLVNLLKKARREWLLKYELGKNLDKYIAKTLIDNGVELLHLKVGCKIYRVNHVLKKVEDWTVVKACIYEEEIVYTDDSENDFVEADFGVSVFLTKEEAVVKLCEILGV